MIKRLISFLFANRSAAARSPLWLGIVVWSLVLWLVCREGAEWQLGTIMPFKPWWSRAGFAVCWCGGLMAGLWWWQRCQRLSWPAQGPADSVIAGPGSAAVATQARFLERWIQVFREVFGARAVSALPWFLMIGFPGSGKSSLLQRANTQNRLHARLQQPLRDLVSAEHLDLFVSDQAVFIDPQGGLIAHPDSEGTTMVGEQACRWQHLLRWLIGLRPRQPLNGVVWTIDLAWLAQASRAERQVYTQVMHQRLQEIRLTFDTPMPLFLVLTKLDLLQGFEQTFQHLEQSARQAVLGVSFSRAADQKRDWAAEVDAFWQQWMAQLHALMPSQMQERADPSRNSALFAFTRQLAGIKHHVQGVLSDSLDAVLSGMLVPQGIYISSVYQHGTQFDAFTSAASRRYQLPDPIPAAMHGESVTFFVHRLFRHVIVPGAQWAGENRAYQASRRRRLAWGVGSMALFSSLLLGGWHYYYRVNAVAADQVLDTLQRVRAIPVPETSTATGYGDEWLPRLNLLRGAALSFGHYRDRTSTLADLGLYQGMKLGPWGEAAYLQSLQLQFLPAIMRGLQAELSSAAAGSEQKLAILRVMRMLDDASGRNSALVEDFMATRWQQRFPTQGKVQEQLLQHLDYALRYTNWIQARQQNDSAAIRAFAPFRESIYLAQRELGQMPLLQRLYQGLVSQATNQLPSSLMLRDEVGPSFDTVFALQDEVAGQIPRWLTRSGMNEFFLHQEQALFALAAQDAWVLGQRERVYLSDADRKALSRQISDRYVADYVTHWQSALAALDISPFASLEQALAVLSSVTGPSNPISRLVSTLDSNTRPPIPGESQHSVVEESIPLRISRPFMSTTAVLAGSDDRASRMDELQGKLVELRRYLDQMVGASDPKQAALSALQHNLGNRHADPAFALRQYASSLPTPLNRWVEQLALQSAQLVTGLALSALNQRWQDEVVMPFNTNLASYYPFDMHAPKDVALSEMERFFAPGGTLDGFYQRQLRPVMEGGLMRDLPLSTSQRDLQDQLARATRIRQTFFNSQGNLEIQFVLEPRDLTSNKRRSVLNLDGQLLEYAHGRRDKIPLVWPNTMRDGAESKITLVPAERDLSPRSIGTVGPWAMFRLMQQGELTRVSDASFDVRFPVDQGAMTYRVYTDASQNPFAGGLFNQFRLPDTLF